MRIMTFNMRYEHKSLPDVNNPWSERINIINDIISRHKPTIIGTQELETWQYNELNEKINERYASFGLSREGDDTEKVAIYYNKNRLKVLEQNTIWFSDKPNLNGSKDWGASLPRIFTYAIFLDISKDMTFLFINLHLDHESDLSRKLSIKQLVEFLETKKMYTIITGDFNMDLKDQNFTPLLEKLNVVRNKCGTFHDFKGVKDGEVIDFIFYSNNFNLGDSKVVYDNDNGKYPSDHYPVVANFKY